MWGRKTRVPASLRAVASFTCLGLSFLVGAKNSPAYRVGTEGGNDQAAACRV